MKKLTDEQSDFIPSISFIGGLIGAILFVYALCSCSTVHKVFHKELHKQDSTAVTHTDSSNVHHSTASSDSLSLTDVAIEVQYDTTAPEPMPTGVPNAEDYFSPSGKVLSDVIKAAKQGGKPTRITISVGRVDNTTRQITSSDSGHVKSSQNVNVKKTDKVVTKTVKRTVFWWWLIPIIIAIGAVYYYRHSIWATALKLFNPLI